MIFLIILKFIIPQYSFQLNKIIPYGMFTYTVIHSDKAAISMRIFLGFLQCIMGVSSDATQLRKV